VDIFSLVGLFLRGYGIYADINECELNYGSGSGVVVVGPLSSRSDLSEHFREFSLPAPNKIY